MQYIHSVNDVLVYIQAMNDEEMCLQTENIRRVLEVERRMEGGCAALLDKDQTLIREGLDPAPSSSPSLSPPAPPSFSPPPLLSLGHEAIETQW